MRFRTVCTALLVMVFAAAASAADSTATGWQKSLQIDFTTTQTSYSDSWVGGEAGSVNWVSNLNGTAEKSLSDWLDYKSKLKLSFGQTLTQDAETKDWSKPVKSTDLIDWENVFRFTLHKFVDPYAAVRLESQFADASNPDKKIYLNPLKLTESIGASRDIYKKEKDFVTTRLGLAARQIFMRSADTSTANLDIVDTTYFDNGMESVTDAEFVLNENLKYTGKLTLYKAFYFSKEDEVGNDYWKAVDVNWENIVSASLTKIITVNLYTQLLYDKEISKKGRFKETLAIGFVFKML
ncbi:MAG TPA: DUF3078 domain-containing protein [candidate division Zixibacteria bacterium]|nr:DUF3078 domain-containing protein [candidate division Zixibacteria bacterium]